MRALALSNPAARLLASKLPPNVAAALAEEMEESGGSAYGRWFNNPDFWAPLTSSAILSKGSGALTFTRATTRTVTDHEGKVQALFSGEIPFQGARRVRNWIPTTSFDLSNAIYVKRNGHAAAVPDATGLSPITVTGALATNQGIFAETVVAAGNSTFVLRGRAIAGTINSIFICIKDIGTDTVRASATVAIGAGIGTVFSVLAPGVTTSGCRIEVAINGAGSGTFWLGELQVENVTTQTNQSPAEYVSVGVLAAPFYGCGVDGVRCFETYNGNSVTANVVTSGTGAPIGLYVNQTATNLLRDATSGFSTPDSVATSVTGSIDLRFYGAGSYSTMPATGLVQKDAVANNRCYALQIGALAVGKLRFFYTTDGATPQIADSSVALPAVCDTQPTWLRVTYDSTSGATKFYYSLDNAATWVQLGTNLTLAAGAIFDGTSSLWVGQQPTSSTSFLGTIYKACVYNGINGALVACFDANDYVTGATFVSSLTRETWTLNGSATVRNFPLAGYPEERASVNLVLQSENFGATWALVGTPTRTAAALRCGSVFLDLIGDDDAAAAEGYNQAVTFTGDAVKAVSFFFAQGTAASFMVRLFDVTAVAARMQATVAWTSGIPTVTPTTGTLLGVDALGAGIFRARMATTAVTAANANRVDVFPATDGGAAVALVGNTYIGGVQAEDGLTCTSYIATAAATVARSADLLTYPTAGNIIDAAGTAYAEFAATSNTVGNTRLIGFNGTVATALSFAGTTVTSLFDGVNSANSNAVGTMANGLTHKTATTWQTARLIASLDGGLGGVTAAYNGAMVGAAASLAIGCNGAGALNLNGTIRNVRIWKAANADSFIQRATA